MNKIDFSSQRILIVDDQRPFLSLLKGVLGTVGAKSIVTSRTCEAALGVCRREKFDLIVCDLHIGSHRKNGFEFLEELREFDLLKPDGVFVLISADAQRPVVLGSIEKQPDEYVVKPFSQGQLLVRLEKALIRKKALAPVYKYINTKNFPAAIEVCQQIIAVNSRYKQLAGRILIELYWQTGQYAEAQQWLTNYRDEHRPIWLYLSKAHTELLLQNYQQAIALANAALQKNSLLVEAYDIMAESWFKLHNQQEAENAINQALRLSPYSLQRQLKACTYARQRQDYEKVIVHSQQMWECSKRSIHRNISYLSGHVRSYLDVAELVNDSKTKGRFQQEAIYALQRHRHNEYISRDEEQFDLDIFEDIIQARIESQNGKLFESKKYMVKAQTAIEEKFNDFPIPLAPDSIAVLLDLGEFEEAYQLSQLLQQRQLAQDEHAAALLRSANRKHKSQQEQYNRNNKLGISLYAEGKFAAAYEAFEQAKNAAPVNIGINLNLLQCSLRLIEQSKKPDPALLKSTRKTYLILKNMSMLKKHQEKFKALKTELEQYLDIQ